MCQVIEHIYRHCRHRHRYEVVNPCQRGFSTSQDRCRADPDTSPQILRRTPLPRTQPLCCRRCLQIKVQWIQQALFVMLIRLKAATTTTTTQQQQQGPHSDEELGWRYRTWRTQYRKETIRIFRTYGYEPDGIHVPPDLDQDEVDSGWDFPLPEAEVRAQLHDLMRRILEGDLHPEEDFWWERM